MRRYAVPAYSKNHGILTCYEIKRISEIAGLLCAAGGIVLGVEVKDDLLPPEIFERYFLTGVAFKAKDRSDVANLEFLWQFVLLSKKEIICFSNRGRAPACKLYGGVAYEARKGRQC